MAAVGPKSKSGLGATEVGRGSKMGRRSTDLGRSRGRAQFSGSVGGEQGLKLKAYNPQGTLVTKVDMRLCRENKVTQRIADWSLRVGKSMSLGTHGKLPVENLGVFRKHLERSSSTSLVALGVQNVSDRSSVKLVADLAYSQHEQDDISLLKNTYNSEFWNSSEIIWSQSEPDVYSNGSQVYFDSLDRLSRLMRQEGKDAVVSSVSDQAKNPSQFPDDHPSDSNMFKVREMSPEGRHSGGPLTACDLRYNDCRQSNEMWRPIFSKVERLVLWELTHIAVVKQPKARQ